MQSNDGGETLQERGRREWFRGLSAFERPDRRSAIRQLLNTVLPYLLLWGGTAWMLRAGLPYWTVVPAVLLAAALLVRVFIIFHDCCHGSFFPSRGANAVTAFLTGLLAFTPYEAWQHPHHRHHATTGDLDRRGVGDVWTMTLEEYQSAPWQRRLRYRVFRNPLVLFVLLPPLMFFVAHRVPRKGCTPRERRSVLFTNLGLLAVAGAAHLTIGLPTYLLIQAPIMAITACIGMWLFYVQHQYEAVYWSRHAEWDPARAALEGSSYYRLPRLLEWFTGSIGYHYLHHLRPRIPNYRLRQCAAQLPVEVGRPPLTLQTSLRSLSLHLWSERERKLVPFSRLRSQPSQAG
jgi:omega-6 fatty acid desaturase (delta-12 desaturase)